MLVRIEWVFTGIAEPLKRPSEAKRKIFNNEIATAATWIKRSGLQIHAYFEAGLHAIDLGYMIMIESYVPRFAGQNVLSLDRWAYWQGNLAEYSRHDTRPLSARVFAKHAVAVMDKIDRSQD
jgi:hypothetical protein